jgi:hypothetical protein
MPKRTVRRGKAEYSKLSVGVIASKRGNLRASLGNRISTIVKTTKPPQGKICTNSQISTKIFIKQLVDF